MLKSGKLKLADDMIVTAQEAANKAETVFTIYDDTTNTQIASGPIGGGGGDGWNLVKIVNVNSVNDNKIYTGYESQVGYNPLRDLFSLKALDIFSGIPAAQDDSVKCEAVWKLGDVTTRLENGQYRYQAGEVPMWTVDFDYSQVETPVLDSFPDEIATLTITWMTNEA